MDRLIYYCKKSYGDLYTEGKKYEVEKLSDSRVLDWRIFTDSALQSEVKAVSMNDKNFQEYFHTVQEERKLTIGRFLE
jgi:hypothetical protein